MYEFVATTAARYAGLLSVQTWWAGPATIRRSSRYEHAALVQLSYRPRSLEESKRFELLGRSSPASPVQTGRVRPLRQLSNNPTDLAESVGFEPTYPARNIRVSNAAR